MHDELIFKQAGKDELDSLLWVEKKSWDPDQQFTEENFLSQFKTFPEGMTCAYLNGKMVGNFILTKVDYDNLTRKDWYSVSDDGDLVKTFNKNGTDLYGVSLSVIKDVRGKGVGSQLVKNAIKLGKEWGMERFLLGCRAPLYYKYSKEFSIEDYLDKVKDIQVEFYRSCGLTPIKVLPEYFRDPESLNYGVLMAKNYGD
jgi:GNAT superfamily N-acetyltransferase